MIGSGSAPAVLAARALLTGDGVPHRWLDTDTDPVGRLLAERVGLGTDQPVAVFPDGSHLVATAGFVEPAPGRARREASESGGRTRARLDRPARTPPELVERYSPPPTGARSSPRAPGCAPGPRRSTATSPSSEPARRG